jgi:hypothetical protein
MVPGELRSRLAMKFARYLLVAFLLSSCGGQANQDSEPHGSGGGPSSGGSAGSGTGGVPDEVVTPEVAACRDYLLDGIKSDGGYGWFNEETAKMACDMCAVEVNECSVIHRCLFAYCDAGEECSCTAGARCLDSLLDEANCPVESEM